MLTFQREIQITVESLNFLLRPKGFKIITKIHLNQIQIKGNLAQYRIVKLDYDQQTEGIAPISIFIKYKKLDLEKSAQQFSINLMTNKCQVNSYRFLQSEGITSIPKIYYGESEQNNKMTLIMQDLSNNYKMLSRQKQLDLHKIQTLFKQMAIIHSKSFAKAEALKQFTFVHETYLLTYKLSTSEQYYQKLKEQKINLQKVFLTLPQRLKGLDPTESPFVNQDFKIFEGVDINQALEDYVSIYIHLQNQSKQKYCFCQNDLRYENIFFDNDNDDVKIVDWQLARKGKPLWDLCKFGLLNLSISQLQNHFLDLVNVYVTKFQSLTNYKFGKEQIYQCIIEYAKYELDMIDLFGSLIIMFLDYGLLKQKSFMILFCYQLVKVTTNFYKYAQNLVK